MSKMITAILLVASVSPVFAAKKPVVKKAAEVLQIAAKKPVVRKAAEPMQIAAKKPVVKKTILFEA